MPNSLQDLFDKDREAYAFFQSLPIFVQDQVKSRSKDIQTKEELSGIANNVMHDALLLDQYETLFEDETDSSIDMM